MTVYDAKIPLLIESHEGRMRRMYKCTAGFNTIGVGHNLDANGLTDRAIDVILVEDIRAVEAGLDRALPWWRKESDARRAALVDLAFNMGVNGLLQFRNTLEAWRTGRHQQAADGLVASKWYGQVGRRAQRIERMVRTGGWPEDLR